MKGPKSLFKVRLQSICHAPIKCFPGGGGLLFSSGVGQQSYEVFRRTWTDAEELLKEKSFFILSFVFLSELVIRQVQTNIY